MSSCSLDSRSLVGPEDVRTEGRGEGVGARTETSLRDVWSALTWVSLAGHREGSTIGATAS
jgi:hypothetical protein